MHELDAILHKIRLVSDADALEQVIALLRAVARLTDNEEARDCLEKEGEFLIEVIPCWEETLNSPSLVFSEPLGLPEFGGGIRVGAHNNVALGNRGPHNAAGIVGGIVPGKGIRDIGSVL